MHRAMQGYAPAGPGEGGEGNDVSPGEGAGEGCTSQGVWGGLYLSGGVERAAAIQEGTGGELTLFLSVSSPQLLLEPAVVPPPPGRSPPPRGCLSDTH